MPGSIGLTCRFAFTVVSTSTLMWADEQLPPNCTLPPISMGWRRHWVKYTHQT